MFWFLTRVIAPITVLGVLVIVHEFGHFIIAKMCRVGVLKFAVGFGPALCKFRRRETTYQIGLIPLGGFVRMVGDMPDVITGDQGTDSAVRENAESSSAQLGELHPPEVQAVLHDRSRWFVEKSLLERSAVVFAGPFFNFVFAALVVFLAVTIYGVRTDLPAEIGGIIEGSPADQAGLLAGDVVKQMNGVDVATWDALAGFIRSSEGKPITFRIERNGVPQEIVATPRAAKNEENGQSRSYFMVGINMPSEYQHQSVSLLEAIQFAGAFVVRTTSGTFGGIWGMVSGKVSTDDLASPIYIFQETGHRAKQGIEELLYLTAFLSVSLAVLNLLPIPILDGGHLLFFLLEAIFGPISVRKKESAQVAGLVFLLGLMVFAVRNDIFRRKMPEDKPVKHWDAISEEQPKAQK